MAKVDIAIPPDDKNGFLPSPDAAGLVRADVYIAAMGRSGSTLLCSLMTFAPGHLCLNEPWFVKGVASRRSYSDLRGAGVEMTPGEWARGQGAGDFGGYLERYRQVIVPVLNRMEKWGAKEVRPEFHVPTMRTIDPKRLVLLVRDVRQVVFSLFLKDLRDGASQEDALHFAVGYSLKAATEILRLHATRKHPVLVVRYEDFTSSRESLLALSRELGWEFRGSPNARFEQIGRDHEAERHQGKVTRARPRSGTDLPEAVARAADHQADRLIDYQRVFGYAG